MVMKTTEQLSHEFPFNLDMNSGKPLGLGEYNSYARLRDDLFNFSDQDGYNPRLVAVQEAAQLLHT